MAALPSQPGPLADRIIGHLRRVGHDSISGIARALQGEGDAPVHRLTVAGYLQAMADLGMLKEVHRPPSKEFQLQDPSSHWTVVERVWKAAQQVPRPLPEQVRLAVAVLESSLNRPLFEVELRRAGIPVPPPGLERIVLPDEVRRSHRRLLEHRGRHQLEVPARDPVWGLAQDDPFRNHSATTELLRRAFVTAASAESLVADRTAGARQASLDLERAG